METPERTFTLSEAQALLPVLRSLLRSAMEAKGAVEQIEREQQDLSSQIMRSGGLQVNFRAALERKKRRDRAVQKLKDVLAEITATGVQVKDLDIGLLDFPCVVEGRVILLCWKADEESITHWHGVHEGFRGRKPIDDSILGGQKRDETS